MSGELTKLGERIRAQRLRLGLTQSELAGEDVTRNMLSRIETGAALPSLPTLVALASRLKVPVGALISDPEDYLDYQLTCEMKRLYALGKYTQILDLCEAHHDVDVSDERKSLLCDTRIRCARELFRVGRLGDAMTQLDEAERLAEVCRYDMTAPAEEIFLLRLMIDACPALSENDSATPALLDGRERVRKAVFDGSELAIYLYCRTELADVAGKAYSDPHPEAEALRVRLEPLIDGLSDPLYRGHIAAKLDMARADYLSAKATLTTLADKTVPPSILYELYADLELCCKCCGDFENAYKYSGARLELIKKIM